METTRARRDDRRGPVRSVVRPSDRCRVRLDSVGWTESQLHDRCAWPRHHEVVVALDAATGKTIWEFKYPSSTTGVDFSQGAGPHATPLIVGNRLYATSSRRELFALDKASGKVLWSHDFIKEYGAPPPGRGYSCSPLLYNGTIIVTVGGPDQAAAAFNPQTGALVWKGG